MRVTVRKIHSGDEDRWRQLWSQYLAYYETGVSEDVFLETFRRLLADDPREFRGLVAEDETGNLVGIAHFLHHRHCWRIENVTYLQDLFVEEDVRSGGVGRALVEAVYDAADAAGAPSVYWLTDEFNSVARRLYDRIGQVTPFIKYSR